MGAESKEKSGGRKRVKKRSEQFLDQGSGMRAGVKVMVTAESK